MTKVKEAKKPAAELTPSFLKACELEVQLAEQRAAFRASEIALQEQVNKLQEAVNTANEARWRFEDAYTALHKRLQFREAQFEVFNTLTACARACVVSWAADAIDDED